MSSNHWWKKHWKLVVASLAILAVTLLSWVLVLNTVRPLIRQTFHERSLAYVQAFASSAAPWIDPLQPSMLQAASRFMLVGSAQVVQVVVEGQFVVDEQSPSLTPITLPALDAKASPGVQDTNLLPHGLDIVASLFPGTPLDRGYVRIVVDSTSITQQSRTLTLWSGTLAFGVDLLLLGLLWWLFGFRSGISARHETHTAEHDIQPLIVGDLEINVAGRQISFKETPLSCTPKQYALLAFLATKPDHVFTDRDIVAVVWKDSSYADSKDVKQYIYLLRRKLAAIHPNGKSLIVTVPGFGYKLVSQPVDTELTNERLP